MTVVWMSNKSPTKFNNINYKVSPQSKTNDRHVCVEEKEET